MRQLIRVEKRDIRNGGDGCDNCPVSLAIKRQTTYSYAGVVGPAVYLGLNPLRNTRYDLPRSVDRFVRKYDNWGKKFVKPFNFYLNT